MAVCGTDSQANPNPETGKPSKTQVGQSERIIQGNQWSDEWGTGTQAFKG